MWGGPSSSLSRLYLAALRASPLNPSPHSIFALQIELVSLIWFLQIWVEIYVYGTMINWLTLIKKLMQTYIVIVSGSIADVSTVHLSGIWHLIWRYLSKPVLGGHPVLSGHYSIPEGVRLIQVSLLWTLWDSTTWRQRERHFFLPTYFVKCSQPSRNWIPRDHTQVQEKK